MKKAMYTPWTHNVEYLYFVIADKHRHVYKTIKHTSENNVKQV